MPRIISRSAGHTGHTVHNGYLGHKCQKDDICHTGNKFHKGRKGQVGHAAFQYTEHILEMNALLINLC